VRAFGVVACAVRAPCTPLCGGGVGGGIGGECGLVTFHHIQCLVPPPPPVHLARLYGCGVHGLLGIPVPPRMHQPFRMHST
jgi:hypothetical protein